MRFHVNLPSEYIKPIFGDVMTIIDTCQCIDQGSVRWYHNGVYVGDGPYYQEEGGLTGSYYATLTMNGVETRTCEQTDVTTLVTEGGTEKVVTVYPNPTTGISTVRVRDFETSRLRDFETSRRRDFKTSRHRDFETSSGRAGETSGERHLMRVLSVNGVEMECREFEGESTVLDLLHYPQGQYLVWVDGKVVRVIRN